VDGDLVTGRDGDLPARLLLHITDAGAWADATASPDRRYRDRSLDAQGFIHLSTPEQVELAADTHYRGVTGLVLLCIDADRLAPAELVFEAGSPPNGHLTFPHLYGPLPVEAVTATVPFPPGPDGRFRLPAHLAGWCS
jgi:uncharacterized protein (DUF952 family)